MVPNKTALSITAVLLFGPAAGLAENVQAPQSLSRPSPGLSPEKGAQQELEVARHLSRNRSIEKESLTRALKERREELLNEASQDLLDERFFLARRKAEEVERLSPDAQDTHALGALFEEMDRYRRPQDIPSSWGEPKKKVLTDEKKTERLQRVFQRADQLLELRKYDLAVEILEQAFLLDPTNSKISKKIDRIKKQFIRETEKKIRETGRIENERMAEEIEVNREVARELIEEGRFAEAQGILARLSLMRPADDEIRRLNTELERARQKGEPRRL